MTAYWAVVSARFRMHLQYRAAALAGIGTQLFFGLVMVMVYGAFYRSTTRPQPMTYPEVVTYIWLGQALLGLLPWSLDLEMLSVIRSGNVAYELLRPVDLYSFWFLRIMGGRLAGTLLRAVPQFLLAGLFLGMQPPASPASGAAWAASTVAAVLLGCAISTVGGISMLWTVSGQGAAELIPTLVVVFSGMVVPLPFFPDWAQRFLDFLPFRGLVDVPFRLYLGHLPPSRAVPLVAQQLLWTAALVGFGRWLLARGTRRVVVQGG
jgi:ABC-2 type transport system permease protein